MTYDNIINTTQPKLLSITNISLLNRALDDDAPFLIYGEIHGIKENADVIYTLVHKLNIRRLAIENSPKVKGFIDAASQGNFDFSLIDTGVFDSSILSIEMAKTLATLLQEGALEEIVYIDTYFDDAIVDESDDLNSPQLRESILADNILQLDSSLRTLCILGRWRTQPEPVRLAAESGTHLSALYRIRKALPNIPFVHNVYGSGALISDGRLIELPTNAEVSQGYRVVKKTDVDFELQTPKATPITSL